jgi:hypothetical protein
MKTWHHLERRQVAEHDPFELVLELLRERVSLGAPQQERRQGAHQLGAALAAELDGGAVGGFCLAPLHGPRVVLVEVLPLPEAACKGAATKTTTTTSRTCIKPHK